MTKQYFLSFFFFSRNQLQAHKVKTKHEIKYISKDVIKTQTVWCVKKLLKRQKTLKSVWDLQ